jgi:hypothetical protein
MWTGGIEAHAAVSTAAAIPGGLIIFVTVLMAFSAVEKAR